MGGSPASEMAAVMQCWCTYKGSSSVVQEGGGGTPDSLGGGRGDKLVSSTDSAHWKGGKGGEIGGWPDRPHHHCAVVTVTSCGLRAEEACRRQGAEPPSAAPAPRAYSAYVREKAVER